MKIYYNSDGRFTQATGDGIFQYSENTNVIQFKIDDIPNDSVVFATILLPFPETSNQYGNYTTQSLLLHNVVDEADGGYMWEADIPGGYLRTSGKAYISARIHTPDGIVIINENEPEGDNRTITIDGVTYDISFTPDGYLVLDDETNEYTADTHTSIIIGDKIYLIEYEDETLKLIDGLRVKTTELVQFIIYPSGEYVATPVIPETAEQIFLELARQQTQIDAINTSLALKQDKTDNTLDTEDKTVVGAINGLNTQVTTNTSDISTIKTEQTTQNTGISTNTTNIATNTTNIATNTSDITSLKSRVSTLEETIITGENYIGTWQGQQEPNDTLLNQLVNSVTHRDPKGGDYLYYTWILPGATDVGYRCSYSNTTGWNIAQIPTVERAGNDTYGIIKGSYGAGQNTELEVTGGNVDEVWVKDNSNTQRRLAEYLNTNATNIATNAQNIATNTSNISSQGNRLTTAESTLTNILNGTTSVGKAVSADKDGQNQNIVDTYLTKTEGATKQQLYDYALPRTFNDVSFVNENHEYTDDIPTEVNPLYTATSSAVGDTQLFYVDKTISNAQFELGNKNSYTTTLYITANTDCSVAYKVTTSAYISGSWTTCNVELTDIVEMRANEIKKINFGSTFNSLTDILNISNGCVIRQSFEVQTTTSSEITFSVYSNETYPSTFYLNTTAQTLIVSQGKIGEVPYYNLYGTLTDNTIDFPISNALNLDTNIVVVFKLNYSETIADGTYITLSYQGNNIRIVTPYNSTSTNATIDNLRQAYTDGTGILFSGLSKVIGGNLYIIANLDNLSLLKEEVDSKVTGNTAITGGTKTKITYDSKGLVTAGADLEASDIPNLTLSKITDITASASELNVLDGITATTSELNILDGVTASASEINVLDGITATTTELNYVDGVTSSIQTQLDNKQAKIDNSNKLNADLVDDSTSTNKFVTSNDITTWNGKQDALDTTQMEAVNSGANSTNIGQISTNTSNIATINGKIPSQASTTNQLADKDFVNSSINALASYYITKDAQGNPFATKAELTSATTFYSGGTARVPTTNDYAIVLADESKTSGGVDPSTRYSYQGGTYPSGQWEYQYTINVTPLTSAQLQAINSGITSSLVTQIGTNQTDIGTLKTNAVTNVTYDSTNKKIKKTINGVTTDVVTLDTTATQDSTNPITSGAVYTGLSGKQATINSSNKLSADLVADGTTNKVFTATEQTKLSGIESGAEVNDLEGVQINGTDLTISGKKVNIVTNTAYDATTNKIATMSDVPTVNNATLTIQKNGTDVATFTANASTNATANISVPTQASDINAQETLVSGTNIKTINGESVLGSGNLTIQAGQQVDVQINGDSIVSNNVANILTNSTYNTATNKIATMNDLPPTITITTTSGSQSVSDGTNTLNFGSNAFNSTTIPTSYVSSVNGSTGAITGIATTSDLNGKLDKVTTGGVTSKIYGVDPQGDQHMFDIQNTNTADTIMFRDSNGRSQVSDATGNNTKEIVNVGFGDGRYAKSDLSNATATRTSSSVTINGKAGTKYTGKHLCIESWKSTDGTQWYRKYDDGWQECGISNFYFSNWGYQKVTLPITFSSTNYTVTSLVVNNTTGNATTGNDSNINDKATNGFYCNCDSNWRKDFYCCGY